MTNLFWRGYCNDDRLAAIHKIQETVLKFGSIIDFKFFALTSITITIEIAKSKVNYLYNELKNNIKMEQSESVGSVSEEETIIFFNVIFKKKGMI